MVGVRRRGEQIRTFILDNVKKHPKDIASVAAKKFGVTRQAINKHIRRLVNQNSIIVSGSTKSRSHALPSEQAFQKSIAISPDLQEDIVWRRELLPVLTDLPDNVLDIWHYGMTEMINNVIDHSNGTSLLVEVRRTAHDCKALVLDNGEGIFAKIQRELGLEDQRHAVLELSKGKLTTDPERHTGEGIFFSSRVFDQFAILSGDVYFSHKFDELEDWILSHEKPGNGTAVFMDLSNNTSRTIKSVFDQFSTDGDFGFNKTVVPVSLVRYGNENLVSRSQAKRLLARVDRFQVVVFDFEDIETIGQAFADQIFRVFQNEHKDIELITLNTTPDIDAMIRRAQNVSI